MGRSSNYRVLRKKLSATESRLLRSSKWTFWRNWRWNTWRQTCLEILARSRWQNVSRTRFWWHSPQGTFRWSNWRGKRFRERFLGRFRRLWSREVRGSNRSFAFLFSFVLGHSYVASSFLTFFLSLCYFLNLSIALLVTLSAFRRLSRVGDEPGTESVF